MKNIFLLLVITLQFTIFGQTAEEYFNRGMVKSLREDYRGAIQDYNKTIELAPKVAIIYYRRGRAKYNLGDKNGACLDWSKAGELGFMTAYDFIKVYCK